MNLAQALHTAARRYCMEKYNYWTAEYSKIVFSGRDRNGYDYTPRALRTFPRYNVLNAILIELERTDPKELADLNDTRDWIVLAGTNANTDFTREPFSAIAADAMENERDSFCHFISSVSEDYLKSIEPLPYRRCLSDSESEAVRSRLYKRWHINGYEWFPLAQCSLSDIMAFEHEGFQQFCSSFSLTDLLSSFGVSRVWELQSSRCYPDYEQDVCLFKLQSEGYWSSDDLDWIVYQSYENSITVGGWLLTEISDQWPEWKKHIWYSGVS